MSVLLGEEMKSLNYAKRHQFYAAKTKWYRRISYYKLWLLKSGTVKCIQLLSQHFAVDLFSYAMEAQPNHLTAAVFGKARSCSIFMS